MAVLGLCECVACALQLGVHDDGYVCAELCVLCAREVEVAKANDLTAVEQDVRRTAARNGFQITYPATLPN